MGTPSVLSIALLWITSLTLALGLPWAVATGARRAGYTPQATRRLTLIVGVALAAWLLVTGFAGARGLLLDFDAVPPPIARIMLPGILLTALLAFSPAGRVLTQGQGYGLLIGYQAFRIPVELMLASLFAEGVVPEQMTFHGRNLDVLTGITALAVAWLASTGRIGRLGILVWNLFGLALLANIVTVAVLSVPGRLQVFTNPPANTIVFHFPFIWLPTVLVLGALLGHLVVFRKLWAERAAEQGVGRGVLA